MTIDEIKSVSIIQFLETQGYHKTHVLKGNYWYLSPFRSEQSPSFNVNPVKNLWYDYGEGQGGNIINLVQKMNPTWNSHEVLSFLENEIRQHNLDFAVDYLARMKEQEDKENWKQRSMRFLISRMILITIHLKKPISTKVMNRIWILLRMKSLSMI